MTLPPGDTGAPPGPGVTMAADGIVTFESVALPGVVLQAGPHRLRSPRHQTLNLL